MAPNVLIIDPDRSAAEATAGVVRRLAPGATVTCEFTLPPLPAAPPDVLMIDPSPFGAAGLELIRCYGAAKADLRVVAVVSLPTAPLRRALRELGVTVYREKPIVLALLLDQLTAVLQGAPIVDGTASIVTI